MKLALFGLMAMSASGVKLLYKDKLIPQVEEMTNEVLAQGELDTEAQPVPTQPAPTQPVPAQPVPNPAPAPARVFSPEEKA